MDSEQFFFELSTPDSTGKILVADIHRAQQTEKVKQLLARCKTNLCHLPGGCTGFIQPMDVSFNKPFKDYIKASSEKHMADNLEKYAEGKITASERRILLTKWVGDAWHKTNKEMVVRSFKK